MIRSNGSIKTLTEEDILHECNALLEQAGVTAPPIDLKLLAQFACINEVVQANIVEAGILEPQEDGNARVLLRERDGGHRQNFTLAHEIIHTFFPDYREKPQRRTDGEVGLYNRNNQLEYLCDFGASQLLMPQFLFQPEFEKQGFTSDALEVLSTIFDSSLEATAIRMVAQDPEKYAMIVWEEKFKPSEERFLFQTSLFGGDLNAPERKLRVKYGRSFNNEGHIPKHKSLEEDGSIILNSYKNDLPNSGKVLLRLNENYIIDCTVHTFPLQNQERIITLLER